MIKFHDVGGKAYYVDPYMVYMVAQSEQSDGRWLVCLRSGMAIVVDEDTAVAVVAAKNARDEDEADFWKRGGND